MTNLKSSKIILFCKIVMVLLLLGRYVFRLVILLTVHKLYIYCALLCMQVFILCGNAVGFIYHKNVILENIVHVFQILSI